MNAAQHLVAIEDGINTRADTIETRARMASAVLNVLLMAMDNEDEVCQAVIHETVSAAIELLSVA